MVQLVACIKRRYAFHLAIWFCIVYSKIWSVALLASLILRLVVCEVKWMHLFAKFILWIC